MKKKYRIILCLLCLMILTSCAASPDYLLEDQFRTEEYLADYDIQLEYPIYNGYRVCRAGDVYYYYDQCSSFIYYYDDISKQSGKLCGKAECTHDNRSCNAYVDGWAASLQLYDGMLYFLGDTAYLYRMDLEGNNREIVMSIISGNNGNTKVAVHRGYVYYSRIKQQVKNGDMQFIYTLKQIELDHPDTEKVIVERICDRYIPEFWFLRRNQMYISLGGCFDGESEYTNIFYEYDVEKGKLSILEENADQWATIRLYGDEEGLDIVQAKSGDNKLQRLLRYDFESKTMKEITQVRMMDLAYIVECDLFEDGFIEYPNFQKGTDAPEYAIVNWEGERIRGGNIFTPLQDGDYDTMNCILAIRSCGQDEKGILLRMDMTVASMDGHTEEEWIQLVRIPHDGDVEILICEENDKI